MADADVRRSARELEAMEAMTRADVTMAWSRARAADVTLQALEETALPRMEETVRAAEAAYASGGGDFLSLLDSAMSRLRLQGQRLQAVARRETARFELERLLGTQVDATGVAP